MFKSIQQKCCISSLIVIVILKSCVAGKMEMFTNEAAFEFAAKWLVYPKMYIGLILPNKYSIDIRDAVKSTRKIIANGDGRNVYFMATSNVTKYETFPHIQNELIWYPFEIGIYGTGCLFLDSSRHNRLHKKHFLFLDENKTNGNFSFEYCKIRFDSRLVLYRKKPNNQSIVEFEEIYKIDETRNRLEKNTLGEIIYGQKEMLFSSLNVSIWIRRNSVKGKVFDAVSKNGVQAAMTVKKSKDSEGNIVIHQSGYHADVIKHLMQTLNFSLNTTVSDMSFNDVLKEVGSGQYDIGLNCFNRNLERNNYADFSFPLLSPIFSLFYVKENKKLCMDTFLQPFASETWVSLMTYVLLMISGFVLVWMTKGNGTLVPTHKTISEPLAKGLNVVLRSLVARRQSSEPISCSSKVSFLVLVFSGFLIFSMYRAVLVAFLASEEDAPPLRTLKELLNSDYRLAVSKGTAGEAVYLNASNDSIEYQVLKKKKIIHFTGSERRFVDLMVEKAPTTSNTILFQLEYVMELSKYYPCKVSKIKGSSRKDSSAGMVFNYHLLLMKESGLTERLYQRNKKKISRSCPNEYTINRIIKQPRPVSTHKTISLYITLVIGLAISLMFLIMERLVDRQDRLPLH